MADATLAPGLYRPEMLLYPSKKKNQLSAPALQSEVLCTCVGVIATATSDLTDLAMGATGSKQSVAFDELEPSEWCARPARWRVSCGVCVFLMSLEQVRHQPAKPGRGIFGERMRGPVTVWCTCAWVRVSFRTWAARRSPQRVHTRPLRVGWWALLPLAEASPSLSPRGHRHGRTAHRPLNRATLAGVHTTRTQVHKGCT